MENENKSANSILHIDTSDISNQISNHAMIALLNTYSRMFLSIIPLDPTKPITWLEIAAMCQSKIDEYFESDNTISRDDVKVIAYIWGKPNIVPSTNDEEHPNSQIN